MNNEVTLTGVVKLTPKTLSDLCAEWKQQRPKNVSASVEVVAIDGTSYSFMEQDQDHGFLFIGVKKRIHELLPLEEIASFTVNFTKVKQ